MLRDDGVYWLNLADSYANNPGNGRGGEQSLTGCPPNRSGRAKDAPGLKPKDLVGIPWRVALALQADGWYLRSDIIWSKPNPMPESVTDRPTKAHEYVFVLTKRERYFWDSEGVKEGLAESTIKDGRNDTGRHTQGKEYSKYFDDTSPDNAGADKPSWYRSKTFVNSASGRNLRTVWNIATAPYSGSHFATWPPKLVEPMIKASTSEKGCCPKCGKQWVRVVEPTGHVNNREPAHVPNNSPTKADSTGWKPTIKDTGRWQPACTCDAGDPIPCTVLDPFAGSGTTLMVARQLGRNAIGLDLSMTYLQECARERLGLTSLDAWTNGKTTAETTLDDLPLFGG